MPNVGKPSQDCHLCRARRVKCDLAKPACLRCIKYGATCPGYRREGDVVFRNEDAGSVELRKKKAAAKAILKTQTAEGPRGPPPPPARRARATPKRVSFSSWLLSTTPAGALKLSPSLQLSYLQSRPAVMQVFTLFSEGSSAGASSFGRLNFLPDLLEETRETSCLASTAELFAAARRSRMPNAQRSTAARMPELYGRSLTSIRNALEHPTKRLEDDTIVAVWLLSLYEAISNTPQATEGSSMPGAWHVHSEGIVGILRARGTRQFLSDRGRRIFWVCFAIIQLRCMVHNTEFPPEARVWLVLLQDNDSPPDRLRYAIAVYGVESCAIVTLLVRVVCNGDPVQACLICPEVLKRMTELEILDPGSTPVSSPRDSTPEVGQNSESPNEPRLQVDNLHRSMRLKMHCWAVLLASFVMSHAAKDPDIGRMCDLAALRHQRAASIQIARRVANHILQLTAAVLKPSSAQPGKPSGAWVNVLRMTWPLLVMQRFQAIIPEQSTIATRYLERIWEHIGINEASKRYGLPISLPPEAEWNPEEVNALTP